VAEEVKLPELGESITEGIITSWLVAVGDAVEVDQPIVEISTDKVDTEIPSPVAGVVQELRADVDDTIEVGQVIALIGEGEASAAPEGEEPSESAEPEAKDKTEDKAEDKAEAAEEPADEATAEPEAKPIPAATESTTSVPTPESEAPTTTAPAAKGITRGEGHTHDVVILGGGTGGYSTALRAAQLGLSVALIERDKVGGTCLHYGCIPTKALLQSAEIAEHAQQADEFGVKLTYEGVEILKVNEHKQSVVDKMHKGLQGALKGRGVETFEGTGRLTSSDTVEVTTGDGTQTVSAPAVVIATGSVPRELPFAPFDGTKVISSDHALELDALPARAIVLGSGAVGMEFATAWHAFGVEVTVVELLDRLLPLEDADSSKEIARAFRKQGITALTATKLTAVDTSGSGVVCTVETSNGDEDKLEADLLLVAVGRGPRSEGVGLEEVGITTDSGFVVVDEYCRTNIDGIWALGDVIPTLGLAHASFAEGMLVADQLGGLDVVPIDYAGVPRVTFSHPEVASVGLNEQEAKDRGHEVVIEKYQMQALGRAAMAKATGMIKLVAEADASAPGGAGRILGIHIVGPRATDLIAEGQLIYNWEALPTDVAQFIHAHPSFGEAIGEAHLALAGRALHG
jgi:dihydrolipoamide dehydrogenase